MGGRLFGNERELQVIDDPIDKLIFIDALVYAFFYSTYDEISQVSVDHPFPVMADRFLPTVVIIVIQASFGLNSIMRVSSSNIGA